MDLECIKVLIIWALFLFQIFIYGGYYVYV